MLSVTIIGVDCATQSARVGVALGTSSDGITTLDHAKLGSSAERPSEIVAGWVRERCDGPVLLALDAPFGWPAPLSETLIHHQAGVELHAEANDLFCRMTDRFVKQHIGIQPLEVGADRIARTAHAALALLENLRRRLNEPIPLAWTPEIRGVAAIEVYPAATLTAHGLDARRYKRTQERPVRERILEGIGARLELSADLEAETMRQNADALDAGVCVLAAHDFLTDHAFPPPEQTLAEREGWIWLREPRS